MRKILLSIFLILIFLCSTAMGETAADWHDKAHALWDGEKYTDPKKAIEYLSNAIKLLPDDAKAYSDRGNAYNKLGHISVPSKTIIKPSFLNRILPCSTATGGLLMASLASISVPSKTSTKPSA